MTDETTWFRALSGPLSRDTFWRLDLGNKAIPSADDLTHIIKHLKLTRGFMREDDPRIRSPRRSPAVSKESLHTETAQPVQTLSPVSESAGAGPAERHLTLQEQEIFKKALWTSVKRVERPPLHIEDYPATPTDDGLDIPAGLDRRGRT